MKWLSRAVTGLTSARSTPSLSFDDWVDYFNWQGHSYGYTGGGTLSGNQEEIGSDFAGLVQGAYKGNGVVFACMLARMLLFSEARFQFRKMQSGRPGELFGSPALLPLEKPWTNATTGDLLKRMIQDADLAGNAYVRRPGRIILPSGRSAPGDIKLRRMRPDWVTILIGSESNPDNPAQAIDAEVAGYVYEPGGKAGTEAPVLLYPEEVAHFAPIPDPTAVFRGMSWLTPIIREVMGDAAATQHKLKYFEGGASPNMVVTAQEGIKAGQPFDSWVEKMKDSLQGMRSAYKTLYLGFGSTAQVVGANLKEVDFKLVQGAGETRIAAAAGVPPIIVGLSEGLESATYSNYGQARRRFADGTMRPLWRDAAGSLSSIIDVPKPTAKATNELWYDDRDIPFLQEDVKDAADAQQVDAVTVRQLIEAGFTPDSVVEAVNAGDFKRLVHSGLVSVQLQLPGAAPATTPDVPAPADEGANDTGRLMRALLSHN